MFGSNLRRSDDRFAALAKGLQGAIALSESRVVGLVTAVPDI